MEQRIALRQRVGLVLVALALLLSGYGLWNTTTDAAEATLQALAKTAVSSSDLSKLKTGQILVTEEESARQGDLRYVMAKLWINRAPDVVWKNLQDQEGLFHGEPHMKQVKVVKVLSPKAQNVAYSLSISRLLPQFDYVTRVNFSDTSRTAQFERISGSFKSFKGFARLQPVSDKQNGVSTVMIYALQLDTGFFVPQFVTRSVLKGGLPDLMTHIRQQIYKRHPHLQAK